MGGVPIVIFCQPLYLHVPPQADMAQKSFIAANVHAGLLHGFLFRSNLYIDKARNFLAHRLLEEEADSTHSLWVDSDMELPGNTIACLLDADKDVVCGLYFGKDHKHTPVLTDYDGNRVTEYRENEVQEIQATGMGCSLIKIEVFRKMRDHFGDEEWFKNDPVEDLHFFRRCRDIGVKTWLDTRFECTHWGDIGITSADWKRNRKNNG